MSAPVFTTFGCRLNAYETQAMTHLAEEAGLRDAVVVNTCAVTGEAVRQARQQIRRSKLTFLYQESTHVNKIVERVLFTKVLCSARGLVKVSS